MEVAAWASWSMGGLQDPLEQVELQGEEEPQGFAGQQGAKAPVLVALDKGGILDRME